MLFVLSIMTLMSCLMWPVQFLSRSRGNYVFLNLWVCFWWIVLASAYVHRECSAGRKTGTRERLLDAAQ